MTRQLLINLSVMHVVGESKLFISTLVVFEPTRLGAVFESSALLACRALGPTRVDINI